MCLFVLDYANEMCDERRPRVEINRPHVFDARTSAATRLLNGAPFVVLALHLVC